MPQLNWNKEKGNPYKFSEKTYEDFTRDTEFRIIKEMPDVPKILERIKMDIRLKDMEGIKKLDQANLVKCSLDDNKKLDKRLKPFDALTVYLDYPFGKVVEVTIYAIKRTFSSQSQRLYFFTVGMIAWEIAKVYGDVYKNQWEKVGVYGHGFSDLYLEEIQIRKDNVLTLYVGS